MANTGMSVAVLTGGQSRRMGADKALVVTQGRPLVEHVVTVVSALTDDVFLVGDRPAYHQFGYRVVPDEYPGGGALGGIATALRAACHDRVLVVACDMPSLCSELLEAMAAIDTDVDVIIPRTSGARQGQPAHETYETLHAIYRRSCLPTLEQRLAAGQLKIADILQDLRVCALDEPWLRRHDRHLASFVNVNSPSDLDRVHSTEQELMGW